MDDKKKFLLRVMRPEGYNPPTCPEMLWNQWLHYGYLQNRISYEFYSENRKEIPRGN